MEMKEFLDFIENGVRATALKFEAPDDDFAPWYFFAMNWGTPEQSMMVVPAFDDDNHKHDVFKLVKQFLAMDGNPCDAVGFVSSTWIKKLNIETQELSEREEAVICKVDLRAGAAGMRLIPIVRSAHQIPALGTSGEDSITPYPTGGELSNPFNTPIPPNYTGDPRHEACHPQKSH